VKEFTGGLDGDLIARLVDITDELKKNQIDLEKILGFEDDDDFCEGDDDCDVCSLCERIGVPCYDVKEVIVCSCYLIDNYGFEPSHSYTATWKYILDVIEKRQYSDSDMCEAENAINWISNLPEDEYTANSYLFNLRQIVDSGYCTMRHFSLLASMIIAYRKYLRKGLEKKSEDNSEFVGEIGDKIEIDVKHLRTTSYQSMYGGGFFHLFIDSDGNVYKWSTTKSMRNSIMGRTVEPGDELCVKGTIKDHEEFRGVKQTVITRCKFACKEMIDKEDETKYIDGVDFVKILSDFEKDLEG
jgi:hypothetical protein